MTQTPMTLAREAGAAGLPFPTAYAINKDGEEVAVAACRIPLDAATRPSRRPYLSGGPTDGGGPLDGRVLNVPKWLPATVLRRLTKSLRVENATKALAMQQRPPQWWTRISESDVRVVAGWTEIVFKFHPDAPAYKAAEKALAKILSRGGQTLDGTRYLIAVAPGGRFAPVLVGVDNVRFIHVGVTVVG